MSRISSLKSLAKMDDPFDKEGNLKTRIKQATSETKYLEWKLVSPVETEVERSTKYRFVKAAISFANTEGGFVVFGIDYSGNIVGLNKKQLLNLDQAKIEEMINGCIFPAISNLHLEIIPIDDNKVGILHVPPSPIMPHVTTKKIALKSNQKKIVLKKYAVYTRQGSKSDIAKPEHFQDIIKNRTEFLRSELLRAVETVQLPTYASSESKVKVFRTTDDPQAIPYRVVKSDDDSTDGVLIHEKLDSDLFNEINNVLKANALLSASENEFALDEKQYYRIYAARESVEEDSNIHEMLAKTAFLNLYAPCFYWMTKLTPSKVGELSGMMFNDPKSPNIYSLMRLVHIIGGELPKLLLNRFKMLYQKNIQPPNHNFTYLDWMELSDKIGSFEMVINTLQVKTFFDIESQTQLNVSDLLEQTDLASRLLSEACSDIWKSKRDKTITRMLDVVTYGPTLARRKKSLEPAIVKSFTPILKQT